MIGNSSYRWWSIVQQWVFLHSVFLTTKAISLSRSIVVYYVFWQRFIHCAIHIVFYVLLLHFPLQITYRNTRSSRLSAKGVNRLLCGSSCYSINLNKAVLPHANIYYVHEWYQETRTRESTLTDLVDGYCNQSM